MKKLLFLSFFLLGTISSNAAGTTSKPFTWKENGITHYSDIPRNMITEGVQELDVRTHSTTPLDKSSKPTSYDGLSIWEKQQKLNEEIARANAENEKARKQQEADMREQNCRIAKTNLKNVQNAARIENRETLLADYQADIDRYCQ